MNGVAHGSSRIAFAGSDVWYPIRGLTELGVAGTAAPAVTIDDERFAELRALSSQLTFSFDPSSLRLALVLHSGLLSQQTLDLRSHAPADLQHVFSPGIVLNYGVDTGAGQQTSYALEQRIALWPHATIENTFGRTTTGAFARGMTGAIVDRPDAMQRISIGDSVVDAGALGGQALIGGVSVERVFSMNPYVTTYPLPSVQTAVDSPSVADIYVNGVLVRSVALAPGRYDLQNLPLDTGQGNAQVVVRGAFGTQSIYNTASYQSSGLLAPGLTDYAYGAGLLRVDPEQPGDRYAGLALVGHYRIGLSQNTTAGALATYSQGTEDLGVELDRNVGFGTLNASLATSFGGTGQGEAAILGFSRQGLRSSFGLVAQLQSKDFVNLDRTALFAQPPFALSATFNSAIDHNTAVSLALQTQRSAIAGIAVAPRVSITRNAGPFTAVLSYDAGINPGLGFSLMRSTGNDASSVSVQSGRDGSAVAQFSHAAASPIGESYSVQTGSGNAPALAMAMQWGLPSMIVRVQGSTQNAGPSGANASVEGSLVFDGSGTYAGQPVRDAYAIVQTGGAAGTGVLFNGQVVAQTDARGNALVPFLQSYQSNRLALAPETSRFDELTGAQERNVAPNHLAGSAIELTSQLVHAVTGTVALVRAGRADEVPAFGRVSAGGERSPIDADGRFYFASLSRGTYAMKIEYADTSCVTKLVVPSFDGVQLDVGRIACAASL